MAVWKEEVYIRFRLHGRAMKRSQPSLRPRFRYLVAEVTAPAGIPEEAFLQAFRREVRDLFGDSGAAAVDARVDAWSPLRPPGDRPGAWRARLLLRTVREETDGARAALAVLREVEGRPVAVRVLGLSGTLRGARRRMGATEGLKGVP